MSEKICLKASHIYLDNEVINPIFENVQFAYVTYSIEQATLLITPVSSQWFVKLYRPAQYLLKSRNLKGDKTLAVRDILIDNDLDMSDRALDYEIIPSTKLIKVRI